MVRLQSTWLRTQTLVLIVIRLVAVVARALAVVLVVVLAMVVNLNDYRPLFKKGRRRNPPLLLKPLCLE